LKSEIEAFKSAFEFLALVVNDSWHLPGDERPHAQPRAALDNAYAALLKKADDLKLDTKPLSDTWSRLSEGFDACATRTFSEAPTYMTKSTAGAQMHLVLKILLRDAAGKR